MKRRKKPYDGPHTTWQDDMQAKAWRPYAGWEVPMVELKKDRHFEWSWATMKNWGLS